LEAVTHLRYVILHHTGIPQPHYDLMLETSPGSPLATFRLPIWPLTKPAGVTPLGDHRREYLEYEGPLSNDRGRVRRVAGGTYHGVIRNDEQWEVVLDGSVRITIHRPPPGGDQWYVERKF
jgi:hypothetical protein